MIPKSPRFSSPKYLTWIRTRPCACCGESGTDHDPVVAHHLIGTGHLRGIGLKTPDSLAIPMKATHHQLWHTHPDYEQQWQWVALTLNAALIDIAEGRLSI